MSGAGLSLPLPHRIFLILHPIADIGFDIQMNPIVVIVISNYVFVIIALPETRRATKSSNHGACNGHLICTDYGSDRTTFGPIWTNGVNPIRRSRGDPLGRPYGRR